MTCEFFVFFLFFTTNIRLGGDHAVVGNAVAVVRCACQHHVHGTERDMDHIKHGHRRIADRSGTEERHQVVGVFARANGHAFGQHGSGPRGPTTHGGQPRGGRFAVFPASAALAVATRSRDIGRGTASAQDSNRLVQVPILYYYTARVPHQNLTLSCKNFCRKTKHLLVPHRTTYIYI